MRRNLFSFLLMVQVICFSVYPLLGWGFNAHKIINREAIHLLPGILGVYFSHHIDYISSHAIDPDLWRDDPKKYPNEMPGHYIDADLYDVYPFENIPKTFVALVKKYGEEKINRWGLAPWRIERYFRMLVNQMRSGQWEGVPLTATALGHYISDIHMPLHVVENYNGQLSGNFGIHKRWESDMVDKYLLDKINPNGDLITVDNPVEEMFKIVKESYRYHLRLLSADSVARESIPLKEQAKIADRDASMEGTSYIEILFRETGDLANQRMETAAVTVASFWYSAWIEAGKPRPPEMVIGEW
ncbi:MAG: hypothetical protein IIA61_06730 [Candidatus Marinimicrobia bacterium]|nr:hypothetical protein [Candidatus Neomarinimicrobiota bacterium]